MGWFHYTKQERMKRSREIRRMHAEDAHKQAADNVFLLPQQIKPALASALEEQRTFEEYFGEPMPQQVQLALHLEVALWQHLLEAIEVKTTVGLTDAQYDEWKTQVRSFLLPLIDLLHAEEEMLTSCLVKHYVEIVHQIQGRVARVSL